METSSEKLNYQAGGLEKINARLRAGEQFSDSQKVADELSRKSLFEDRWAKHCQARTKT